MKSCLPVLLILSAMVCCCREAFSEEQAGNQQAARLETQVKVELSYLLYLPRGYDQQESWPLLLFLHGSGERGDDLELVKKHGPPRLVAEGRDFPFIIVSPQCPKERWWEPIELLALLNDLGGKYKVDADRVYATGLSMGGFGTWRLAFQAPDRFAAIAPICGGGEKYWAKRIAKLPVWAFHGAKDAGVPPERSQIMIDAIAKNGGHPKLTVYPEAEHDSWTETYNNPELYKWLLEQKRPSAEQVGR
ncbi:MAG TPA: dienelactone hydrolase family protein [Pirellulales bacterium]|nr:dienelactone hydrolase family protein [Pirellulales bacterium]